MRPRISNRGFRVATVSNTSFTTSREEVLRKKFIGEGLTEEEMKEFASYKPFAHQCFERSVQQTTSNEVELTIFGKKMMVPYAIAKGAGFIK